MMTRQKRESQPRCFTFTPEMLRLMQEAMKLFAHSLARAEGQPAKVAFARAIMHQVNGKLDAMCTPAGAMDLTTFDYNEKIVLAAAIQLYMLDLVSAPAHFQCEKQLRQCKHIMQFALDPGRVPEQ